jgi:hypothetical protein
MGATCSSHEETTYRWVVLLFVILLSYLGLLGTMSLIGLFVGGSVTLFWRVVNGERRGGTNMHSTVSPARTPPHKQVQLLHASTVEHPLYVAADVADGIQVGACTVCVLKLVCRFLVLQDAYVVVTLAGCM